MCKKPKYDRFVENGDGPLIVDLSNVTGEPFDMSDYLPADDDDTEDDE